MTRSTAVLAFTTLAFGVAQGAAAQSKTVTGETIRVQATVEAIDMADRSITVKDTDGNYHELAMPEGSRMGEVKVGDKLVINYYENVNVRVKAKDEPDVNLEHTAATPAEGSAKPAGTVAKQRRMTARITAIDLKAPAITFTGPNDWKYSTRVEDRKALEKVKVGDRVDITWTEAVLIGFEKAK